MPIVSFENRDPHIASDAFVSPDAWVIGDVTIKSLSSIFFTAVLRGDIEAIKIGERSNIQDGAILHTSTGLSPCIVGDQVTVGHRAILHGCTVSNRCIVGMGATILDGALIEEDVIIGANSLVPMNKIIPRGSLAFGNPIRIVRELSTAEVASIIDSSVSYQRKAKKYRAIFAQKN
ncbi:MAG: gamma carbonic anhydrase family protein [Bdellovibrionales bacterium]|nr:gamma carbonic anhydrase family protein [Bdellovibrionales bacterium]